MLDKATNSKIEKQSIDRTDFQNYSEDIAKSDEEMVQQNSCVQTLASSPSIRLSGVMQADSRASPRRLFSSPAWIVFLLGAILLYQTIYYFVDPISAATLPPVYVANTESLATCISSSKSSVRHMFQLINSSHEPAIISIRSVSCGCADISIDGQSVVIGQSIGLEHERSLVATIKCSDVVGTKTVDLELDIVAPGGNRSSIWLSATTQSVKESE